MKLATFNVNGIRSRLAHLLQWLAQEQPDIVCLQELKALDASFPIAAIREAGYGALWHGQRSWNGVQPPQEVHVLGKQARLVVAADGFEIPRRPTVALLSHGHR